MKKSFTGFYIFISIFSILFIIVLATGLWKNFIPSQTTDSVRTTFITVTDADSIFSTGQSGNIFWEDNLNTKIPLEDGETAIAVLNRESGSDFPEEQFVVYRNNADSAFFITFLAFDDRTRNYRRLWDIPVAASRIDTITMYSMDLIGDRNNCIVVNGMNANNEHTMTIIRRTSGQNYIKIAEIQIDGSIVIQETGRTLAYQQGMSRGQSFNIAAYGHDTSSFNILDQIETIYSFNPSNGVYEQIRLTRIPGSQIEQRRLRELLSGVPGVFEDFLNDLWYFVSPQGTEDTKQFLYFDPAGKEIIFFGDEAQQVFIWQNSAYTRLGMRISSQNISINTLRRNIFIELESLNSIRVTVDEDVRLRITANTAWDGTYRRAGPLFTRETISEIQQSINAVYDSTWGRIQFHDSGEYTINSGGNIRRGHYVLYQIDGKNLLELRHTEGDERRMVYTTEYAAGVLILSRVRIGTSGVQELLEPPITLTPVN
ncbi:MAG: pallilysin-related adhesin [Treponema sp.]|nr:pallilysin-related adhesin [Treponema sp.]